MAYTNSTPAMTVGNRNDFLTAVFCYQDASTMSDAQNETDKCYRAMQAYLQGPGKGDLESRREFERLVTPLRVNREAGLTDLPNYAAYGVEASRATDLRDANDEEAELPDYAAYGVEALQATDVLGRRTPPPPKCPPLVPTSIAERRRVLDESAPERENITAVVPPAGRNFYESFFSAPYDRAHQQDNREGAHAGKRSAFRSFEEDQRAVLREHRRADPSSLSYSFRSLEGASWLSNYQKWTFSSLGNALIVTLRFLQTGKVAFPLTLLHRVSLETLIVCLKRHQDEASSRYHSIASDAVAIFSKALQEKNEDEFDMIRVSSLELLASSEMQEIKHRELQNALMPIMNYLDGNGMPQGVTIEAAIEQALTVFRRWGWIEAEGQWQEQGDTIQLLEVLSQWLIERKQLCDTGCFTSSAEMVQDRSQWVRVQVLATDERDLIRNAYKRMGEKVPEDLQDATRRDVYIQSILAKASSDSPLTGLLTTVEERITSPYAPQPVKFYGLSVVSAQHGQLVPGAELDRAISRHTFHGADQLPAFAVEGEAPNFGSSGYSMDLRL